MESVTIFNPPSAKIRRRTEVHKCPQEQEEGDLFEKAWKENVLRVSEAAVVEDAAASEDISGVVEGVEAAVEAVEAVAMAREEDIEEQWANLSPLPEVEAEEENEIVDVVENEVEEGEEDQILTI